MYTVGTLLTSLNRKVSPGNINQSRDIFGVISEASRNLLTEIKPKELSRRVIIENALYDQVYKFKCPDDLDQKNVMQWFKLDSVHNVDTFFHEVRQTTNRRFDQHRVSDKNIFTIEWDTGVKFIKVSNMNGHGNGSNSGNTGLTIHNMNSLNDNGTWNTFGNVTDLVRDNLTYVTGNGSLRFDINTSSNTGGIENFTLEPFDISEYLTVGKIFTWLDLPQVQQIQTIQLEMYSSPGNGYSVTVNSPHDCDSFQLGQNMLGFILDTNTMTVIGSPDPKNINHIKFTFTTNGTLLLRNVRMDNIVARKGNVYGIQYISKFMFKDQNGLLKQDPTTNSDEILLEFEAYQLLLQECACILGQEIFTDTALGRKGYAAGRLAEMNQRLAEDYRMYRKNYKAEFIDEQQDMYYFGVNYGYYGRSDGSSGRWDHTRDNV